LDADQLIAMAYFLGGRFFQFLKALRTEQITWIPFRISWAESIATVFDHDRQALILQRLPDEITSSP
jgi:hypothetical protein